MTREQVLHEYFAAIGLNRAIAHSNGHEGMVIRFLDFLSAAGLLAGNDDGTFDRVGERETGCLMLQGQWDPTKFLWRRVIEEDPGNET